MSVGSIGFSLAHSDPNSEAEKVKRSDSFINKIAYD